MILKSDTQLQDGKYRIIRMLGQGGFGITYEAEQVNLGRKVAIKEFFMKDCCEREKDDLSVTVGTASQRELVNKFKTKFIKEAQTIAGFTHPNVVKILDVFEENGTAYYVMELLTGGSLFDLVYNSGPMSEIRAIDYIRQISSALCYIHEHNTVHLDVKPSNILLNTDGDAVLIDFGASKHYDKAGEQTSTTPIGYSKGYAPIEQYRDGDVKQFKPATDIYALGATLYTLVTAQVPPEASIVYEDGLVNIYGISDSLWRVIQKSMMPKRKDRPQTIDAFLSLFDADDEKTIILGKQSQTVDDDDEETDDNDYQYLTNDGKVTVHSGHGKYWLMIDEERISDYYDDIITNTLVEDCIVCAKRDGFYSYLYIDVVNKRVESTSFKYEYANAIRGKSYFRGLAIERLLDKQGIFLSVIYNIHDSTYCALGLKKQSNSYALVEQDFSYYPQSPDNEAFWIGMLFSVIGFSAIGFIAAGILQFSIMIGAILGFLLGVIISIVNKKECVHEAHIDAVGGSRVVLGVLEASSKRDGVESKLGRTNGPIWCPPPVKPHNDKVQRRDVSSVNASVFRNGSAPSCDSISEVICPLTGAKGYYRIERGGKIGMRRITDNGEIQELFPFDGDDDTYFEDAWLRLHG